MTENLPARIETTKIEINQSAKDVFDFLNNLGNFRKIFPSSAKGWSLHDDKISFNLSGIADFGMQFANSVENREIRLVSSEKSPFDFDLKIKIEARDDGKSEVQVVFDGKMNPAFRAIATKPLEVFFLEMAKNLKKLTEKM
ncbi:MAG: hypothetical protein COA57_14545 [Flavobacteriales bacterium]|nr:MAG: hypothetical protein COA57_14545 [Flavobacteriales bacterium]